MNADLYTPYFLRSLPPNGYVHSEFRRESRSLDPPHSLGPTPFRLRPDDFDPPPKDWPVQDEGLELPAFAARMDASGFLKSEQVRYDGLIPPAPEPARVEAFGGDARERDVEPRGQGVAHESSRIVPP